MNRLFRVSGHLGLYPELLSQPHLVIGCTFLTDGHTKFAMKERNFIRHKCIIVNNHVNVSSNLCRYWHRYIPDHIVRRQKQTSSNDNTCWNCHKILKLDTNRLFCEFCNSLQPVDKFTDLFKIMGIERSYSLNQSELKQIFRNLQTLLHPDKFSSKPKKEQEFSEEYSSAVNKAYSTLLDPLERGLYLLNLNSISIEEGTTDIDKQFLMEIMERNEEIENESNPAKLNEFNKVNRKQIDLLISKVTKAFENNDLELAKKLLTEMKYYNTIENKIKEIKQKLNIPD